MVPLLILLGILGGFYVVPIDSFIQIASLNEDRGQNVAAGNFLNFLGVIIASGFIAFFGNVLGMSAAEGFLIVGILTLGIAITLLILVADQVLRLIIAKAALLFLDLKVLGRKNIRLSPPVLLIGQRMSWLDTVMVMATLPRLVRYIVPIEGRFLKERSFLYRLLRLIPVDMSHFSQIGMPALKEINHELNLGHSVCLMLPTSVESKSLKEWETKLSELIKETAIPIVPVHITRKQTVGKLSYFRQLQILFKNPIKVSYGTKITIE